MTVYQNDTVIDILAELNIDSMSPIQALTKLMELKRLAIKEVIAREVADQPVEVCGGQTTEGN